MEGLCGQARILMEYEKEDTLFIRYFIIESYRLDRYMVKTEKGKK